MNSLAGRKSMGVAPAAPTDLRERDRSEENTPQQVMALSAARGYNVVCASGAPNLKSDQY